MQTKRNQILFHIFLCAFSILMLFPIIWWVCATFKLTGDLGEKTFFPSNPTFSNYIKGWVAPSTGTFARYFLNSLFIEFFAVIGSAFSSAIVAFGFARMEFKFKNFWFSILMLTLMLPSQVTTVPQYILYSKLHFTDGYLPLILPQFFGGAFHVFLVVQFIRSIPRELDEAATIDGSNIFGIFWKIILPLIRTPLVTVAIFTFIWSWDDFYSQVLYISTPAKFTVGLGLRSFIDQFDVQWGQLLAMALLSIIPSMVLFFAAQKEFVAGIATTGIKG